MANLLDFLAERNRYYPIYISLSSCLKIAEIVALTRTCKKLSNLYQELLAARHWDVDRDLGRFVDDPSGIRAQLKQHNAYIYGEFAYCFFKNETEEGYEVGPVPYDEAEFDTLIRINIHDTVSSRIHITTTGSLPLRYILLTTVGSINIISWNKAVTIFPGFDYVDNADRSFINLGNSAHKHLTEYHSAD